MALTEDMLPNPEAAPDHRVILIMSMDNLTVPILELYSLNHPPAAPSTTTFSSPGGQLGLLVNSVLCAITTLRIYIACNKRTSRTRIASGDQAHELT
jgi:hypothetical protein